KYSGNIQLGFLPPSAWCPSMQTPATFMESLTSDTKKKACALCPDQIFYAQLLLKFEQHPQRIS
ncbi:MAG: hypothetical protein V1782_02665, partial [Pseudomonadota bacterium]